MSDSYVINKNISLHINNYTTLLETNDFSAKIKHPALKEILTKIVEDKLTHINAKQLSRLCEENNINTPPVLNFLTKETGILKLQTTENKFNHLYLVGDSPVQKLLAESFGQEKGLTVHEASLDEKINTPNSIILYFTKTLDESVIKRLYQANQNPKNYIVTAYLLGKHLIIDNPYSKHFALPCHFCHIERLKKNASLVGEEQKSSWLSHFKQMLKDNDQILYEPNHPPIYDNYIAYTLFQFVRRFTDPFYELPHYVDYSKFWHTNLDKMTTFKENGVFWPFCDCQTNTSGC